MKKLDKEFEQICAYIRNRRNEVIGFLNYATVSTYWAVGAYVADRVASKAWNAGSVLQFCDYVKTRYPKLRGFGQRQIYNMVEFYKIYSTPEFAKIVDRLKLQEFILPKAPSNLQLATAKDDSKRIDGLQLVTANESKGCLNIPEMPEFLALITFTNHIEIIARCRSLEEKVFYILYSMRERMTQMQLRRAIVSQAYESVMSKEKRVTKTLREKYPDAEFMMKDKVFLEFLGLPEKHTEPKLRREILNHMKQFILELGKDYLYMGDEYHVKVGAKDKRIDLLFYHRGLNCLVDVELKAVEFKPEFISKMNVYLAALDRDVKRPHENPSVGLLLCPSADGTEVKYTLDSNLSPIMVAEYKRLLIPAEVIKKSLDEYCEFMKKESSSQKGPRSFSGQKGGL